MPSPFDALFTQVKPLERPEKVRRRSRGKCDTCHRPVFWADLAGTRTLCEMVDGKVVAHQCVPKI